MNKEVLKREIGVFGLTTHMVNSIIGSGIFVLPAIIAAGLGPASIIACRQHTPLLGKSHLYFLYNPAALQYGDDLT